MKPVPKVWLLIDHKITDGLKQEESDNFVDLSSAADAMSQISLQTSAVITCVLLLLSLSFSIPIQVDINMVLGSSVASDLKYVKVKRHQGDKLSLISLMLRATHLCSCSK